MLRRLRCGKSGLLVSLDVRVDASAVVEIVMGAVGAIVIVVVIGAVTAVDGMSGWIRCGSGLLPGVRGRRRRMMRLWI